MEDPDSAKSLDHDPDSVNLDMAVPPNGNMVAVVFTPSKIVFQLLSVDNSEFLFFIRH